MKRLSEEEYLIRLTHADREIYKGVDYFFNNRSREYEGHCVIQRTTVGRAFLEREGQRFEVPEGYAMLFAHGEESSYGLVPEYRTRYELEWLGFAGGNALTLLAALRQELGPVFRFPVETEGYRRFEGLLASVSEMRGHDRFELATEVTGCLNSLFRLPQELGEACPVEERALHLMENEFASPLNLTLIAQRVGASREHLTRQFARRYGTSPAMRLREIRIRYATELLLISPMDIAEVAIRCGMSDVNTFCRAFKRKHGVSPSRFRELRKVS